MNRLISDGAQLKVAVLGSAVLAGASLVGAPEVAP